MKCIAVIPARYHSSRFPKKMLEKLGDTTVIAQTYKNACAMNLFDEVLVATDHEAIQDEIQRIGGNVVLTSSAHESGSDRIAEAIKDRAVDVVVNIQGDEPFVPKHPLADLVELMKNDTAQKIDVATLAEPYSQSSQQTNNPNVVKVVVNKWDEALYFSRANIPYDREASDALLFLRHIGVYAYRKKALLAFASLPSSPLEKREKLEQLRYLENGYTVKVLRSAFSTIGIDTPEDLTKAQAYWQQIQSK